MESPKDKNETLHQGFRLDTKTRVLLISKWEQRRFYTNLMISPNRYIKMLSVPSVSRQKYKKKSGLTAQFISTKQSKLHDDRSATDAEESLLNNVNINWLSEKCFKKIRQH